MEYKFNYTNYEKTIRTNPRGFVAIIITIIILLGLAVYLTQTKPDYVNFYFVEMGNFNNYKDASNYANTIQQKEGAGYIFFDTSYHVLANFYYNKKEAENVCNNLVPAYPNTKVLTLKAKKFNTKTAQDKKQKSLIDFLDCCDKTLSSVSKANIRYDNNTDSLRIYQTNLSLILDNATTPMKNLKNNFSEHKYLPLLTFADNIMAQLDKFDDGNHISSKQKMRYSTIEIAINYYNFLENL